MKHEIILHAGMPKTGTSAIQRTLHGADMPGCAYLDWGDSFNHSPAYITAFTENAFSATFDKGRGRTRSEIEATRQRYRSELSARLDAATAPRLVLSAEAFSTTGGAESLTAFRNAIAPWTGSLRVILYVRPLASALPSLFQQNVKLSRPRKTITPRVPYRASVSRLTEVFGDAVELVPYLPATFPQGDVVRDFCARIGVPAITDAPRVNTSMTAEAAALLFVHGRHKAERAPRADAVAVQAMVVRWLKDIGGTKLRYTPELVRAYAQVHKQELDWISERVGFDVADLKGTSPDGVGSPEDLRALAIGVEPALRDLIAQRCADLADGQIDLDARLAQVARIRNADKRLAAQVDLIKDMAILKIENAEHQSRLTDLIPEGSGLRNFARKLRQAIPALRT